MKTKITELEKVIELWKKEGITSASFEFACGGDSMNDTEWHFYKKGKHTSNVHITIKDYLDELVYKRVDFYDASDGHYQGEAGNVEVTLNDEQDDFEFMKSSTAEFSEQFSGEVELELTEKEASFIQGNILNFSGNEFVGDYNVDYSRDFILTAKQNKMVAAIAERMREMACDYKPEDAEGEERDEFTFEAEVSNMSGNIITIKVSKEYTVFRDSED